jgi:membrane protein implicated in regulation of membrane protease activity
VIGRETFTGDNRIKKVDKGKRARRVLKLVTLYLICIGIGVVFAFVTILFGDSHGHTVMGHIPLMQPVSLVSGITAFGGAGILLSSLTLFSPPLTFWLSVCSAVLISFISYFVWVRPMKDAESSTGFSVYQLSGKLGEVLTAIPANGLGEVIVTMVNGRSNHMAASYDSQSIGVGTRVVVVEVKNHVLYVTPFEKEEQLDDR